MATHSSIFAWKIPWTEEPHRLQSTWLQRIGCDRAYACTHTHVVVNTKLIAKKPPSWGNFKSIRIREGKTLVQIYMLI